MRYTILTTFVLLCCLQAIIAKQPRVSLEVEKQPLGSVLDILAHQAQINIVYSDRLVDSVLISCRFNDLTADEALTIILQNTSLAYQWVTSSRVVLVPAADVSFSIYGYVIDAESKESLPFANIFVEGTTIGTTTNREGRFFLQKVPFGKHQVVVDYMGYLPKSMSIQPADSGKRIVIELGQTTYLAENVDINAFQDEVIRISHQPSQLVISPQNFSSLPMIGDHDIFRSLQLMPGISSSSNSEAGLYIRGGQPSDNLIRLDGMTLYHTDHAFGFLGSFNVDAVKHVQVHKGAYPAKYGGRVSGVIDMTAKNGNLSKKSFQAAITPLSLRFLSEVPINKSTVLMLAVRRSLLPGILKDSYKKNLEVLFPPPPFFFLQQTNSDTSISTSFYDVHTKLTLTPTSKDILVTSFYLGNDNAGMDFFWQNGGDGSNTSFYRQTYSTTVNSNWGNNGFSVKWFRQWSTNFHWTIWTAYSNYSTDEQSVFGYREQEIAGSGDPTGIDSLDESQIGDFQGSSDLQDLNITAENSWQIGKSHLVEFGGEISLKNSIYQDTETSITRFGSTGEDSVGRSTYRQDEQTIMGAVYAQDSWQLSPDITMVSGLRLTRHEIIDKLFWEPRASLNFDVFENFSLKGAYGQFNQFLVQANDSLPTLTKVIKWVIADQKAFQPASATHYVAGLQYSTPNLLADLEFYYHDLDGLFAENSIPRKSVTDIVNSHSGFSRGFDFLLQKKGGAVNGWVSYSYNNSRINRRDSSGTFHEPSGHETPHNIRIVANYRRPKWQLTGAWRFASGEPYTDANLSLLNDIFFFETQQNGLNDRRLPASHRLDIAITRYFEHVNFDGFIRLSLFNLYNHNNVRYRYSDISINFQSPQPFQVVDRDIRSFGFTPTLSVEVQF